MKNHDAEYRVIEMKQLQEIDGRGGATQKHLSNISYKMSYSLAKQKKYCSTVLQSPPLLLGFLTNTLCLFTYHTPSRCQVLL
jgi:hypothetical protein